MMNRLLRILSFFLGLGLLTGIILLGKLGLDPNTGRLPGICSYKNSDCNQNNPSNGHIIYNNTKVYCVCKNFESDITNYIVGIWIAVIFMLLASILLFLPIFCMLIPSKETNIPIKPIFKNQCGLY